MNRIEEKVFLIKVLGTLISLKDEILTIDDSGYYIFRPQVIKILKEKKCNNQIIDLLKKCLEIEDIKDLLPDMYYSNLESLINGTMKQLQEFTIKIDEVLKTSFEKIECNINLKQDLEKNILIEIIGMLEAIDNDLITIEEGKTYLFNMICIQMLENKKCNKRLIKLMYDLYEMKQMDKKFKEDAMMQLKEYPEIFV